MTRCSPLVRFGLVFAAIVTSVAATPEQGRSNSATPPREAAVTDQAEVSGFVVSAGATPAPLARVLVTLSGAPLKIGRTVITDDHGRFLFRNLPGGTFAIVAFRPPYVKTAFGAKRPGRPGTPIDLAAGQRVSDLTIAMARGGAITGLVRHASGEPALAVRVEVLPLDAQADLLTGSIVTDNRGVYRAFGLPPGRYVVSARIGDTTGPELMQFSDAEMDGILEKLKRRPGRATGVIGTATPGATAPASMGLPAVATVRSPTYGHARSSIRARPIPSRRPSSSWRQETNDPGSMSSSDSCARSRSKDALRPRVMRRRPARRLR